MTIPTEDEVRAWLAESAGYCDQIALDGSAKTAALYRRALALLDEARKDRERLDWLETTGCYVAVSPTEYVAAKLPGFRAAIDQARGA